MTCAQWIDRWFRDFPRTAETTNTHNRQMLRAFREEFGKRELATLNRLEAKRWATRHRGNARVVSTLLSDAVDAGLIERNPFAGLRLPKGRGRRDIEIPTEGQIASLIMAAEAPVDSMIRFAAYTGVRLGEQLALRRRDFYQDGERAIIRRQLNKLGHFAPMKGALDQRQIVVPEIATYRLEMPASAEIWRISRSSHWRRWNAARCQVGLPDLDWHGLRHFAATWFLELGASPEDTAVQLGHDDGGELVRQLYGHPDPVKALDRLDRLARLAG